MSTAETKKGKNFGGVMIMLVVITCLSKLFGFMRDIVLTNLYGASPTADAYLATLSMPDMLLDLLAHSTTIGFVPIAVAKLANSRDNMNSFANSVVKLLMFIGVLLVAVVEIFPGATLNLLAPGFEGETMEMATVFLRIIALTILFRTMANIFHAYLNASKWFLPGAFLGVILDCSVIAAIIISKRIEFVYLLPMGAVIGAFLQMIFLTPFTVKIGFRPMLRAPIWSEDVKNLLILIIPAAMSVGVMQISTIVNKALASSIVVGGITMLSHSSKISYFAENIIVSSIVTVLYPLLSEYHIKGERTLFAKSIEDAIDKLLTFLVPITAGLAFLSYPIISILYGHGEFTEENVRITAGLMMINVLGIVGIAIQTLLTRVLFSMKKVKVSTITSASLLVLYVSFSFLLSRFFGLTGIAIGTTLSYTFGGITYYVIVHKLCPEFKYKRNLVTLVKALGCTAVMCGVLFAVKCLIHLPQIPMTILSVAVGALTYFAVAQLVHLKDASIKSLVSMLKKK